MSLRSMFVTALCLAALTTVPLRAQSKTDAFGKAVAQLQDAPDDLALRKKVITLAQGLSEAPPLPDEVTVLKGKAVFVAKNATAAADYQGAVDAYKRATLLAPWDGDLYYNKGVMEEKAGQPAQAIEDFKLYLFAKPDADDKAKVLERLGKLEVLQDKASQQQQQAVAHQQKAAENSVAMQKWESQKTASTVVVVLGAIGLCVGAVELGLGYGDESSAGYTVSPGYNNGVLYNKLYEGKYWSKDSYDQYTNGQGEVQTGWLVGGIGTGVMLLGFLMGPGPQPGGDALLNLHGSQLAYGLPLMRMDAHGGMRGELLHATF